MKKIFTLSAVILGLVLSASAVDRRNFWVLNNTGKTMTALYLAVHGTGNWSRNVFGNETITSGKGAVVAFSDGNNTCVYDISIVYGDGTRQDYVSRNVCDYPAIQFDIHESTGMDFK